MKILFIRNADRFSGSETYDINLFKEISKCSFIDVYFLTNLKSFYKRASILRLTANIISWGEEGIGTKKQLLSTLFRLPYILPRYISLICKLENNTRFDLICLQSMTEKIFLTPLLRIFGYKVIWTELGPIYATKMSKVVKLLYNVASSLVNRIITISRDTEQDLIYGGVLARKICTLYIGIDTDLFKPLSIFEMSFLKKRLHIRPDTFIIGYLGTVTDEKGILEFVEISNVLIKKGLKFHFVIIGDGPFLLWVKRYIRKNKIQKYYSCFGFVEDVANYLGLIDVLLLPTRHYEGLPLAILEAQSMGKVVVTSSMGGNPEIIKNNVNGFLYTYFNKTIIANYIVSLYLQVSEMTKLSKNARENIITRFNIKIQGKKFIKLLQTL